MSVVFENREVAKHQFDNDDNFVFEIQEIELKVCEYKH